MRTAVIAGASGLVGSELMRLLLQGNDYQKVISISRSELPIVNKKLEQLIIDFEKLDDVKNIITGDTVFSCMGSTRSKTPDLEKYKQIEVWYPAKIAAFGKQNGVNQFHYISSIGADLQSSNFYLRFKGEAEDALTHLGLPSVHIYQPSLITGRKNGRNFSESVLPALMRFFNPLLVGKLKKYRSISAAAIASAMYKQSLVADTGIFIHPSDHIQKLA